MNKVFVIGIGPGGLEHMTPCAMKALEESEAVVGYKTYVELIKDIIDEKKVFSKGMKKEVERCNMALELASKGMTTCVVSSGDAGVYGMAGLMLELDYEEHGVEIEIVPGITAANAAAASLGAPLMHDYVVISLSDLLTDWELIETRLDCAGQGDFVVALYNPRSMGRQKHMARAQEILMRHKRPDTPVGIVRNAKRDGESIILTNLKDMPIEDIDMSSIVLIGNSCTRIKSGKIVTPRGYSI